MSRVLWRSEYKQDAYADQTGMKHWGNVVHEVVNVDDVSHFSQTEPYSNKEYPDAGIQAVAPDGRVFKGYANLTDYYGTRSWQDEKGQWWKDPPRSLSGWVDEAGRPVK